MTRLLVVCCFSFLLAGVSGADVNVMVGDSVPLSIDPGEIKGEERLQWNFENKIIASINLNDKNTAAVYDNERFTNRLYLDRKTGSLTINNITTEDSGKYQLKIKGRNNKDFNPSKTFNVTVTDQTYTMSAIKEGDSFSLHPGVKKEPNYVLHWTFNGADFLSGTGFENMNVNNHGELIITNIRPEQYGEYEVKSNDRDFTLRRTFRVSDEVKSLSGVKGKTVTLNINTKTQADDVIKWIFENTLVAEVGGKIDYALNERFRDKLDVNWNGSLIIKDLQTKDSGLYVVNITNGSHSSQKRFNVTVIDTSPRSHQVKIGPGFFLVMIMLVISLV